MTIAAPSVTQYDLPGSGALTGPNFPDLQVVSLVAPGTSLTATDTSSVFQVPYIAIGSKSRLVVNLQTLTGGTSPTLTVTLIEDISAATAGGTAFNPGTAIHTSGSLSATGVAWEAAVSGPISPFLKLTGTVTGGPSTLTFGAWLIVYNR